MPWLALGTTTRELREGDTVVGSGSDADWRVTNADLNPRHFLVRIRGGESTVEPTSPDNVLALSGKQLLGAAGIRNGQAILAGSGHFWFTDGPPQTAMQAEVAPNEAYLVDQSDRVAHPLSTRSTPIGRDASNAVVLRDPTASRFHAEVRREAGGFAIHSMGAMGALLNGQRLEHPVILKDGDTVEIAFAKLRFFHHVSAGDVAVAPPHSIRNDESGRRPTLEPGERLVVDEDNPAGRHTRRVQTLAVLGVLLAVALWWMLGRRG